MNSSSNTSPPVVPSARRSSVSLPMLSQEAINTLLPAARERLRTLFKERSDMLPIKVSYFELQQPADQWSIFELRKNGSTYALTPTVPGPSLVPVADGTFIYVVRADDPGRVYVGVPFGRVGIDQERFGIQGHTSLTRREDVLYAGEIFLNKGKLMSWGNGSGHYQPDADLRHTNLLPVVQSLLPEAKFLNFWRPEYTASRAELDKLRGYIDLTDPLPQSSNSSSDRLRLRVGNSEIRLQEMIKLGTMIDGQPLQTALRSANASSLLHSGLADRLSFDGDILRRQMQAQRIEGIDSLMLELVAQRTGSAPLVSSPPGGSRLTDALNEQLGRFKSAVAKAASGAKSNVVTYLMPGGGIVRQTGVGLQAFGAYNSVRNLSEAIGRGDTSEAVIQAAGLGAEGASLAAEAAIPALGRALQAGNVARFNAFAATRFGQQLGGTARLGTNIARSGGIAGTLITAPFEIYNAVTSFQQAAASTGKVAQDHYVNGGLATVGAGVSIGLGAAAFAGVSAAGPVGLVVGIGLVVGGGIYRSVRYVDDLDEHAGLSAGERFVTGLHSFVGGAASQEIEDRAAVGRARKIYDGAKKKQMREILKKENWRTAIYGNALITPQPPIEHWVSLALDPFDDALELEQMPAEVIDNAADDSIDASAGLHGIPNHVCNWGSASKKILWATGDGNDRLTGVRGQSNVFSLRKGIKTVRGGDQDDIIVLGAIPGNGSVFDGGAGSDTLVLGSRGAPGANRHAAALQAVDVVLDSDDSDRERDRSSAIDNELVENGGYSAQSSSGGRVTTRTSFSGRSSTQSSSGGRFSTRNSSGGSESVVRAAGNLWWDGKRSALRSIENVVTAADTTTSVTGNSGDNLFVLNGHGDSAAGKGGSDTYIVQGGGTVKLRVGPGDNSVGIKRGIDAVNIWSGSGKDRMKLDFDQAEITLEVVGNSLVIALDDDGKRKEVCFRDQFRTAADGTQVALRNNGDILLWTRDNYALAPILSSVGKARDGMIEYAATQASGPEAQAMDLLIQYAAGLAGTPVGAGSGTQGSSMAATAQSLTQATLANPSLT